MQWNLRTFSKPEVIGSLLTEEKSGDSRVPFLSHKQRAKNSVLRIQSNKYKYFYK